MSNNTKCPVCGRTVNVTKNNDKTLIAAHSSSIQYTMCYGSYTPILIKKQKSVISYYDDYPTPTPE
jgi:hypothetical protein